MEAKFNNPFTAEGNWFKGNLHTHTKNSDGTLPPEDTIQQYKEGGYHFLALTDHCRLTRVEDNHGMLLIPGEEIHCGTTQMKTNFHIVGLDLKNEISYENDEIQIFKKKWNEVQPQEVIDAINSQGGVAVLAHPYWSALTVNDMFSCQGYLATEVFNTGCFYGNDNGYSMVHWDHLLGAGRNVFGFAVDDSHNQANDHTPTDLCGAWLMVRSKKLGQREIMDSIKKGLFYASHGPEIKDIRVSGSSVYVATSPVQSITFVSLNGYSAKFSAVRKEPLREAEFKLRGHERYIRVQCTDAQGRMAWSNAVFFE